MLERHVDTYVSKLDLSNLAQSTNNFPTDFIRNVELGQGHIRRPEKGVLGDRHGCGHDLVCPQDSSRDVQSVQSNRRFRKRPLGEAK